MPEENAEGKVGKINIKFVLYQCQAWVNRPSLVAWLKDKIKHNQDMLEIMGPNYGKEYATKIECYQSLIDMVLNLDPNQPGAEDVGCG